MTTTRLSDSVVVDMEIERIATILHDVKTKGHGTVIVKVSDHKVVYIEHTIGEQVKAKVTR